MNNCRRPPAVIPATDNPYAYVRDVFGYDKNLVSFALKAHEANLRARHEHKRQRDIAAALTVALLEGFVETPGLAGHIFIGLNIAGFALYTGYKQYRTLSTHVKAGRSFLRLPDKTDDARLNQELIREQVTLSRLVKPARMLGAAFDWAFRTPAAYKPK